MDGSLHRFTPEHIIQIEKKLGADIIFVLEECTSPSHDSYYTKAAMERTHLWTLRGVEEFHRIPESSPVLWGIVQGEAFQDLREESAGFVADQNFDGYGIGGSLGNSKKDMLNVLEGKIPSLPLTKPRHLFGCWDNGGYLWSCGARNQLF